jgi:hypothetical protein
MPRILHRGQQNTQIGSSRRIVRPTPPFGADLNLNPLACRPASIQDRTSSLTLDAKPSIRAVDLRPERTELLGICAHMPATRPRGEGRQYRVVRSQRLPHGSPIPGRLAGPDSRHRGRRWSNRTGPSSGRTRRIRSDRSMSSQMIDCVSRIASSLRPSATGSQAVADRRGTRPVSDTRQSVRSTIRRSAA